MTTIIAFAVADVSSGRAALERLTGLVDDTALAFRDQHGAVTVHQSSDLGAGSSDVGHGLRGVAVALAATSSLRIPVGGARADRARRELIRLGVNLDDLGLAGEQIAAGAAAAFMVAEDDNATAIGSVLRSAGYQDVRCVHMPEGAVRVLRDTQHLDERVSRPTPTS